VLKCLSIAYRLWIVGAAQAFMCVMDSREELSCLYTAFSSDDTLIEIIPSFDLPASLSLHSMSNSFGPFTAGIGTNVSLWLALSLYQKSLCSVSLPEWLSSYNLTEILNFEKKNADLWPDSARLPYYYFEITHRLSVAHEASSHTKYAIFLDKSLVLLVHDIFEVRLDKLRQEFQRTLSSNTQVELQVLVNGIGAHELAILKPFVLQALDDRHFLGQESENDADSEQVIPGWTNDGNKPTTTSLRRF
jgi:hypothetical protein